jgi:transposase
MYNKWGENAKLSSSNGHLAAMEQWSGPERAVAVSVYYRNGDSVIAAQRVFRRHYEIPPRGQVLSAHAIRTWVRNFEETGSALTSEERCVPE